MRWAAVIAGGALGSAARHGVNVMTARLAGNPVPYATAIVNMIGSFVIGLLAGAIASARLSMTPEVQTFVFVGILGGFTTFSGFMLDSMTMLKTGLSAGAALNLAGQLVLGMALVYAGYQLGIRN